MLERIDALDAVEGKQTVCVSVGERTFEIALQAAGTLGLAVGLEVPPGLLLQIEAAADRRMAAARVMRYLRGRPRTAAEVRGYLARHGHPNATVEGVIRELETRGLVDDVRYATMFVDGRLAHRPNGVVRLVRDLCTRGVARPIAEAAARQAVGGRESELALRAARSKFPAAKRLGRERGLRRLMAFLAQRGFSAAVVRQVSLELFIGEPAVPRPPRRAPSASRHRRASASDSKEP